MLQLNAPRNFAIVEPQLYRSCIFSRDHFPFLRQLKLRSVLYLSAEEVPKSLTEFCNEEERLTLLSPITKQVFGRDWTLLSGEVIKVALEMLLDNDKLPLIIVCLNGVAQTGPLVGCLRRTQNWSFTSILEEHRRFVDVVAKSQIENFIEQFDVDIVTVPRNPPEWFASEVTMLIEEEHMERAQKEERMLK